MSQNREEMVTMLMEDKTILYGMDPDKMTAPRRLDDLARLLATAMLRLWLNRRKEREFCRDNCLGCPDETRPPAVDLQQKG